ncbi:MAG: hypothetical protein GC186_01580 [Rhodobacteraceae bacterium]|nr:hypothetical protein [Paracoccaceae bacterium]
MADARALSGLSRLADLILDARLAELRQAAAARDASLAALAALRCAPTTTPAGLPPLVLARAALAYEGWADARRAEINPRLARQTAAWLEAQAAARIAFGRAEVLRQLGSRGASRR